MFRCAEKSPSVSAPVTVWELMPARVEAGGEDDEDEVGEPGSFAELSAPCHVLAPAPLPKPRAGPRSIQDRGS